MKKKAKPYSISLREDIVEDLDYIVEMLGDKSKSRSNVIEGLISDFINRNIVALEKYKAFKEDGVNQWEIQ